jgi:hypothetical protein
LTVAPPEALTVSAMAAASSSGRSVMTTAS